MAEAYGVTEQIEFCCELYYRAKSIGDPVILSSDEMVRMIERFKDYGKNRRTRGNIIIKISIMENLGEVMYEGFSYGRG